MMWLALTAYLASALIPAGWMPSSAGEGLLRLVICTGRGIETVSLQGHEQRRAPDGKHAAAHGLCAFAAANAVALLCKVPALPSRPAPFIERLAGAETLFALAAPRIHGHGPRGPPVSL